MSPCRFRHKPRERRFVLRDIVFMIRTSWISDFFPLHLEWLQVEISTHCNASCLYCPRTHFAANWQNRLMAPDLFCRLLPIFKTTSLVYLQGWGEPLLHPALFDFIDQARQAGCRVGTTTNALLLNEATCRRLIASGIDVLALSLAGINQENDRIRRGTRLQQVMDAIAMLDRLKKQMGTDKPALHIAYVLLRSRLDDLEALPAFFASKGLEQVVISTLDLVTDPCLAAETLLPADATEYAALRCRLDAMVAEGAALGLPIHVWLARPVLDETGCAANDQPAVCTENIQQSAVIGVDGSVSPCVYARLPVTGEVRCWAGGRESIFRPLIFGTLHSTSFAALWRSRAYRAFRRAHRTGIPPLSCLDCVRMRMG